MKKKIENKKIITKDMKLDDVLKIKESARYILMGFGMHCLGCPIHEFETIEEAANVHGIDPDYLLEKLNEL
ncbi:MAG: DUF1858 domain-containing protein [Clostridia bacterium]|jgi:hybrid cluster-associated redox disulfide protein|nr:DUF1858 domain-containing protein [Clostridia bacterium]MDD4275631.1 DUF1858 domain-containing protein [Clostridia bacterium]